MFATVTKGGKPTIGRHFCAAASQEPQFLVTSRSKTSVSWTSRDLIGPVHKEQVEQIPSWPLQLLKRHSKEGCCARVSAKKLMIQAGIHTGPHSCLTICVQRLQGLAKARSSEESVRTSRDSIGPPHAQQLEHMSLWPLQLFERQPIEGIYNHVSAKKPTI
jgi:hypothetical protein